MRLILQSFSCPPVGRRRLTSRKFLLRPSSTDCKPRWTKKNQTSVVTSSSAMVKAARIPPGLAASTGSPHTASGQRSRLFYWFWWDTRVLLQLVCFQICYCLQLFFAGCWGFCLRSICGEVRTLARIKRQVNNLLSWASIAFLFVWKIVSRARNPWRGDVVCDCDASSITGIVMVFSTVMVLFWSQACNWNALKFWGFEFGWRMPVHLLKKYHIWPTSQLTLLLS